MFSEAGLPLLCCVVFCRQFDVWTLCFDIGRSRQAHLSVRKKLPAVGFFCRDLQQLAAPGGTSKLLESLFM